MNYGEFVGDVQGRTRLRSADEAEAVVANVFRAIAEVLPHRNVEEMGGSLPAELMVYLRGAHEEPDPYFDEHLFLGWVVSTIDATGSRDKTAGGLDLYAHYSGDEAAYRCESVFAALKPLIKDGHRQLILSALPEGIAELFARA